MAEAKRPKVASTWTAIIAVVGLALWITGLIGLFSLGPLPGVPSTAQVLFACSGMFASVLFAFAGLIHTATIPTGPAPVAPGSH